METKESRATLLAAAEGEVDAPPFFVQRSARVRRDFVWAVAFASAYALSLILGGVAASKANPAFETLSSPSALAVRPSRGRVGASAAARAPQRCRSGRPLVNLQSSAGPRVRAGGHRSALAQRWVAGSVLRASPSH